MISAKFLQGLVFICFFVLSSRSALAETLGFYLPHIYSVQTMEKIFKADPVLGKYDIMVFSKIRDFLRAHAQNPFDIAILPGSFGVHYDDFQAVLSLRKGGGDTLHFKLLALNKNWDKKNLDRGVVGVVDEIGDRKKFKSYAKELLPQKVKRFKRIAKASDLYPMLALENVDYILMTAEDLQQVQKELKSKPFEVMHSKPVESPKIYQRKGISIDVEVLKGIQAKTLKQLGYDQLAQIKS